MNIEIGVLLVRFIKRQKGLGYSFLKTGLCDRIITTHVSMLAYYNQAHKAKKGNELPQLQSCTHIRQNTSPDWIQR